MEKQPSIWLITADQMRADAMGVMNPAVKTPALNQLASEGALVTGAYCASPICTPSRASIFTGRYPHVHGAWNIGLSLNEDEVTLADHLREAGYRTIGVGKMHFRPQCQPGFSREPEDPAFRDRGRAQDGLYYGFDEHHLTEDNYVGDYLNWLREQHPEAAARFERDRFRSGDAAGDVWESEMPPELHQTHWTAERSIEAIARHEDDRPLFLWTSFVDPHHPFDPPKAYAEMYDDESIELPPVSDSEGEGKSLRPPHLLRQGERGYWPGGGEEHAYNDAHMRRLIRNYYAMITFMDEQIGRIRDAWQKRGLDEDLLVVFTSDHGELLGDHGLLYKGPWFYEGLTRVPMIVRGPGITKGLRTLALMEHVDIVPTLLDAIGRAKPHGVQGISQLEALSAHAPGLRDSALTAYDAHDRGIRAKCLRTQHHKLVVFAGEAYGELYDLQDDPQENHNRFFDPNYQNVRQQLMEQLVHRLIGDEDPLPERRANW